MNIKYTSTWSSTSGLINVSVLGIVLIASSLFFYGIRITVLFYLDLSSDLCQAPGELSLHLDFAVLLTIFTLMQLFSIL